MSELKSYKMVDEDYCDNALCVVPSDVYLKSEADEVICHQKYKRCLAMAEWCFAKANFHYIIGRKEGRQFAKDNFRRGNLYSKWCNRWKKLAEQFKEAK
jgi:hypothetical protein